MTRDELLAKINEIRESIAPAPMGSFTDEVAAHWHNYGGDFSAHEIAHALSCFAYGGAVTDIRLGPAASWRPDTIGYCQHDALPAFAQLVVAVSGEVAMARRQGRTPDFSQQCLESDMTSVREIIGRDDFTNAPLFQAAVREANRILDRYSMALACLTLRLTRPPFRIDGTDFERLMKSWSNKSE